MSPRAGGSRARRGGLGLFVLLALLARVGPGAHAQPVRIAVVPTDRDPAVRQAHSAALVAGLGTDLQPIDRRAQASLVGASPEIASGLEALTAAEAALDAGDLDAGSDAAARAVLALAAARAGGVWTAALERAWIARFVAAERSGDRARARRAADALRALAPERNGPPPGIDAQGWSRYPSLDALASAPAVAVAVSGTGGAALFVDHAAAGALPATLHLSEGEHLFAAGRDRRGISAFADVRWGARVPELVVPDPVDDPLAGMAARLRGAGGPEPKVVRSVLAVTGARFAVIGSDGAWQVWDGGRPLAGASDARELRDIVRAALERPRVGLDPTRPLLREPRPADRAGRPRQPWWVYASIGAAIALAGGVILADELADDRQRIHIRF
jgi:hypothetical protein